MLNKSDTKNKKGDLNNKALWDTWKLVPKQITQ